MEGYDQSPVKEVGVSLDRRIFLFTMVMLSGEPDNKRSMASYKSALKGGKE